MAFSDVALNESLRDELSHLYLYFHLVQVFSGYIQQLSNTSKIITPNPQKFRLGCTKSVSAATGLDPFSAQTQSPPTQNPITGVHLFECAARPACCYLLSFLEVRRSECSQLAERSQFHSLLLLCYKLSFRVSLRRFITTLWFNSHVGSDEGRSTSSPPECHYP